MLSSVVVIMRRIFLGGLEVPEGGGGGWGIGSESSSTTPSRTGDTCLEEDDCFLWLILETSFLAFIFLTIFFHLDFDGFSWTGASSIP